MGQGSSRGRVRGSTEGGIWQARGMELELTIRLGKYLGSQDDIRIKHVKGIFIFFLFFLIAMRSQ